MQAGTPRFGSTGLSNIGKGAILLLDLPIMVGSVPVEVLTIRTADAQSTRDPLETLP
jgi:hypothetical protein